MIKIMGYVVFALCHYFLIVARAAASLELSVTKPTIFLTTYHLPTYY